MKTKADLPRNFRDFKFQSQGRDVRRGAEYICTACTTSMAHRIATALNYHTPAYERAANQNKEAR
jgi:hypothetical protein